MHDESRSPQAQIKARTSGRAGGRWWRRLAPAALGLAAAAGLGGVAFAATDAWLAADARQQAADAWAGLGRCLLGDGLTGDERPSQRLRTIALGLGDQPPADEASWPERCRPHAEQLDAALARPTFQPGFGSLPPAVAALDGTRPLAERGAAADALWRALRLEDLPLPRAAKAAATGPPRAPAPVRAALKLRDLRPLATVGANGHLDASYDLAAGRLLRLLVTERGRAPTLCELGDGADHRPFAEAQCRPLTWIGPASLTARRLSQAAPSTPALVYATADRGADGFYDAASGQRIWRPRFADAQAFVRQSGEIAILYGVPKQGDEPRDRPGPLEMGSPRIDHLRLVRLAPGHAPSNRRLDIPARAQARLLDGGLLFWHDHGDAQRLWVTRMLDADPWMTQPTAVGSLPRGSTLRGACAAGQSTATLFGPAPGSDGEPLHALAWVEPGGSGRLHQLGPSRTPMRLACHGPLAMVTALSEAGIVSQWQCAATGCKRSDSKALPGMVAARAPAVVQSVGDRALAVWLSPHAGLRFRLGGAADLHRAAETVLLDAESVAELAPTSLELDGQQGVAVLWIRAATGALYAIRVDRSGQALPLAGSR